MTTTTTAIVRRLHPRRAQVQQNSGGKGFTLTGSLKAHQVQAALAAAPNQFTTGRNMTLMLLQMGNGSMAVNRTLRKSRTTCRFRWEVARARGHQRFSSG